MLARHTAAGARTYLTDALGSVVAQTDEDQQPINWYSYSPYGEVATIGNDEQNPVQYTGRENDGAGLYYYRARYYDPVLKRFISEDPIGLGGGINHFAYVEGNPLSMIDPYGLQGQMSRSRGRTPPNPNNGGRTGVFGCLLGCASYIEGDPEAQLSISPSLGGGFMLCSKPRIPDPQPPSCPADEEPQPPKNCGMYDPNCDNSIDPAASFTRGGAGLGLSRNPDGSFCVLIGPFVSAPLISPTINLGGTSE